MLVFRKRVVSVAVQPALFRLRRCNHRMTARARVLARVTIGRAVAAEGLAASLARPQMHPIGTDLYTLFTFQALRMFDVLNCVEMRAALVIHNHSRRVPRASCQASLNLCDCHSTFADSGGATLY